MNDSKERKKLGLSKGEFLKGSFGEIFITNKMRFIYHCSICREKLNTMIAFKKHWHLKHASKFEELDESPVEFKVEQGSINKHNEIGLLRNDPLAQNTIKVENTTAGLLTNENYENEQPHLSVKSENNEVVIAEACEISIEEEPFFQCNQCDRVFTKKHSLALHKRKHTHKLKFSCTECNKHFMGEKQLKMHLLWHQGERPYICSWCGNSYRSIRAVNIHERLHTNTRPYKCPHCPKDFYKNKHFKDHVVIHTQERAHACDICNSTFPRRKALKSHMKIHENKKEHVCNICGKAYNQRPGLYFHMKNKHQLLPNNKPGA